jgi:hypothetical protein
MPDIGVWKTRTAVTADGLPRSYGVSDAAD